MKAGMNQLPAPKRPECPFFQRMETRSVVCEGIVDKSSLVWRFWTVKDRDIQYRAFCCESYEKCETYALLEALHEDDDLITNKP